MVNKKENKTETSVTSLFFKISIFSLILYFIPFTEAIAQNISKSFISLPQEDGTLYFIVPQDGFKNKENKEDFIFDITYLTSKDSAVINFSYFDRSKIDIDSIFFITNNNIIKSKATKIFIDSKKNNWHYRYHQIFT